MTTRSEKITVPALRGIFGTWVYYSSMMRLGDVARYVKTADEIRKSAKLSEMIQRELKGSRAKEIAQYLCRQEDRFLNSLVVAVYGGAPKWFPLGDITRSPEDLQTELIDADDLATIGFLSLSGQEHFFALDGQHRLAGIRLAVKDCRDRADDEINVLFVAHQETTAGRKRTRRLFTTLNKRAKAVAKGAIIALDEDDAMAITCRRLVEEHPWFAGDRIAYQATNNMPVTNQKAFTTLGALYDVLASLFCDVYGGKRETLKFYRPNDDDLDEWHKKTALFFECLYNSFDCYRAFCDAGNNFAKVTTKYRSSAGGAVLFRPIGLLIFVDALERLKKLHKTGIDVLVSHLARLDWSLNAPPFTNVIWNADALRMTTGTRTLCRDLVLWMAGEKGNGITVARSYARTKGVSIEKAREFLNGLKCLERLDE